MAAKSNLGEKRQDATYYLKQAEKSKLCRLCARESRHLIHIFHEEGKSKQIPNKINSLLPIQVNETDILPVKICLRCYSALETAFELHESSIAANKALMTLMFGDRQQIYTNEQLAGKSVDLDPLFSQSPLHFDFDVPITSADSPISEKEDGICVPSSDSNPLPIPVCPEELITTTAFEYGFKHLQSFWCDACELGVKTSQEFCEHLVQKHNTKPIMCNRCTVFFETYNQLYDHSVEVHKFTQNPSLSTQRKYGLRTRQEKRRPRIQRSNRECPKCHKLFPYEKYKAHMVGEYRKARKSKQPAPTKFKCEECQQEFPGENKEEYKKHRLEHRKARMAEKIKNSSISCDYCDKKCLDESSKKSHMLHFHREYKPFKCDVCNKQYHNKSSLENHMHMHSSTNSTFLCDTCGGCFTSPMLLHNHIRRQHNTKPCLFCDKHFGLILMKRHMDKEHFHERKYRCDICYHSFYSTAEVDEHKRLHSSKQSECYFCGKIFASALNTHLESRHQNDTGGYMCPVKSCRQQFALTSEILKHCVGHSKDDFSKPRLEKRDKLKLLICQHCDVSFRYMSQYLSHVREHGPGDVTFMCGICNETHSSEDGLTNHLETHEKAYDFDCRHCRETFVTDTKRNVHVQFVHRSNGAVFKCTQCPKVFSYKYKLEQHKAAHSVERKLSCHLCSSKFLCKKSLDQHFAVKHTTSRIQSCSQCDKEFRYPFDLKKHYMNVHLQRKVYRCDHCDFERNVRKQVWQHMQEVHNISPLASKNNEMSD